MNYHVTAFRCMVHCDWFKTRWPSRFYKSFLKNLFWARKFLPSLHFRHRICVVVPRNDCRRREFRSKNANNACVCIVALQPHRSRSNAHSILCSMFCYSGPSGDWWRRPIAMISRHAQCSLNDVKGHYYEGNVQTPRCYVEGQLSTVCSGLQAFMTLSI